jgi:hypothetical protein
MTINPFSPILDTAVGNVIQVLSNSTVAPPSAGTIAFSNSQFSVNENGIPITQVTLTRTGGSTGAVSATLNLSNGTATAGNDYIQTPIIVTFADGETSKTVNLTQASQGLSFDGIDSYVNVGDKASLVVSNAMTMQAWINPTRAYISYEPEAFIDKQGEYQLFRFPDGTMATIPSLVARAMIFSMAKPEAIPCKVA